MKFIKNFTYVLLFFTFTTISFADSTYFVDFKFVLNESNAGKKAQTELKNLLNQEIKNLNKKEKSLQEEEKKIIQQKKIITPEEYKKKVDALREKVKNLQKERNQILSNISKKKEKARAELLKKLNPIIKKYMVDNKIRMVIDKKNLILADEKVNITKDILNKLNEELKSIKLN